MTDAMHVFVVEPHPIFRRGLTECLRSLQAVGRVTESAEVAEAIAHPAFADADVVVVDHELPGTRGLLRARDGQGDGVIVLLADSYGDIREAVEAGAIGFLSRSTLTPESLAGAVQAAANGTRVVTPGLLAGLAGRRPAATGTAVGAGGPPGASWLSGREQQVLTLIADGLPTREVAQRLSYSERTVKNVLHDVVIKLGARSRSQAVAHAVRDGLI
ncbi:response regulator transcription factor [Baekduia soli]|uniref:Response regulator transcription factor n=1 Tax=Baekduia soli TaxID=496014 RepID=A0A5B8U5Q8_9ACTN|nr:response regulator transcription factor [Baekduia soli]QEC48456.1 response regulator transcription factor [Baekduia soli]